MPDVGCFDKADCAEGEHAFRLSQIRDITDLQIEHGNEQASNPTLYRVQRSRRCCWGDIHTVMAKQYADSSYQAAN